MENIGIILWFTVALISSITCYKLAVKNKLNIGIAIVFGFLAPILSPIVYLYINSNIYKRIHTNPQQTARLRKWSFILGGVLLVLVGITSFGSSVDASESIGYILCILGGGYLIYWGFTKYKNTRSKE